ncbi:MAG: hypothetical protein POH28_09760 [Acidocella sp.]|nr:hypothetical protein [Acidocella sp.]
MPNRNAMVRALLKYRPMVLGLAICLSGCVQPPTFHPMVTSTAAPGPATSIISTDMKKAYIDGFVAGRRYQLRRDRAFEAAQNAKLHPSALPASAAPAKTGAACPPAALPPSNPPMPNAVPPDNNQGSYNPDGPAKPLSGSTVPF